ncbi:MAG: class I SAM-dependent methyltransferase [Ardenticatenales bacterium]|nr:class I SAM-dependent methyltransferase [Ardenticatenales bacterium]
MTKPKVNYDALAPQYNQRFNEEQPSDTERALRALARRVGARHVLEVACGTGHWLAALHEVCPAVYGLDLSAGMLSQARARPQPLRLARGRAEQLPFATTIFDLVYCINAIHHFDEPERFIREAQRVLRAGQPLAVIGGVPHEQRESWYVYEFFEGCYETDVARFPTWEQVAGWMSAAGFEGIERREVERIVDHRQGRAVLEDPFLRKHSCSQLALLSDEAYAAGLARIEAALVAAETQGETLLFPVDLSVSMLLGYKRGH